MDTREFLASSFVYRLPMYLRILVFLLMYGEKVLL
uniref:Uridine kinase n=1 Tax=Rhizophora mucronata TaxID=61149 RepID=A0A2P2PTA1_RHIMU